ncbi:unnamed protein product [Boreogadus saida]
MFAKATAKYVEEVDKNLMPASSCNNSIKLLSIVMKRKGWSWPWQKPKYAATPYTLDEILQADTVKLPDVTVTDGSQYTEHGSAKNQASIDATLLPDLAQVTVAHESTSDHNKNFGVLEKEDMDLQKIYEVFQDRLIDMDHMLFKHERGWTVSGLVTQRIVTTQTSTISQSDQQANTIGGKIVHMITKIGGNVNAEISRGRFSCLTIQPNTTIAYMKHKLSVEPNGVFDLRTSLHDESGGLGLTSCTMPSSTWLTKVVAKLSPNFELLSGLKPSARAPLLQHLVSAMRQCGAVHLLERVLSQMLELPSLDCVEVEAQREALQGILDVLSDNGLETEDPNSPLGAFHLVTSALAEMSDEGLAVLVSSCTPPDSQMLGSLELLVQCMIVNGEMSLSSDELAPLTGETFQLTKELFSSCGVCLQRDGDVLRTKLSYYYDPQPLLLCIAIKGLASLARC